MSTCPIFHYMISVMQWKLSIIPTSTGRHEYLDSDYGMYTWPCASVLAQYVYSQREAIRGKQVLELGAGTAVPGIVAAKCGAKVTLTDSSTNQVLLDNLSRTCQLNEVSDVRVMGLSWGVFSPSLLSLEPQDFILASDCFYESRDFEDVLATMVFVMELSAHTKCWVTYQERSSNRSLQPLMERWNLHCETKSLPSDARDKVMIDGPPCGSLSSVSTIHVWEITKLPQQSCKN